MGHSRHQQERDNILECPQASHDSIDDRRRGRKEVPWCRIGSTSEERKRPKKRPRSRGDNWVEEGQCRPHRPRALEVHLQGE